MVAPTTTTSGFSLGRGELRAAGAGLSAATASVLGKLAGSPADGRVVFWVRHGTRLLTGGLGIAAGGGFEDAVVWGFRALCIAAMLGANGVMWSLFVRAMAGSTSVRASVINNASNYFLSGTAGWLLFGELLPPMWWLGASFICVGLVLVLSDQPSKEESEKSKKPTRGKSPSRTKKDR
jgi:drug/metabolite transporter (DMT)-like permease